MGPTIVRKIPRADTQVIAQLREQGVATVHEAQGRSGLMRPYLRPIYPTAKAAGSAVTVSCQPGDNLMLHAALDVCQAGDILVVTTTSESTDGMFGELLAVSARAHGVVGLLIAAAVLFATSVSGYAQSGPFAPLAGSWRGAGTLSLTPGRREEITPTLPKGRASASEAKERRLRRETMGFPLFV